MSSFAINRVILVGNLTRDPELRALSSGLSVCRFRIACNSTRRDDDGEYQEKPNYFDVSVFGAQAEHVNRYTRKGSRVAVDGHLTWSEWETSDQQKRQEVSIIADTVMFLSSPGERADGKPGVGGFGDEIDQELDLEIDQRPASELVGVGTGAEDDDLVF